MKYIGCTVNYTKPTVQAETFYSRLITTAALLTNIRKAAD